MVADIQRAPLLIDAAELLDALVTSVFVLDQDLRVLYLNAAAQTLAGLSANQALGRRLQELVRGADNLLPLFSHALADAEVVVHRELKLPGPGGIERVLDCNVTQVAIGLHASRLLVEIGDITRHRRQTRENALLAQLGGSRVMVRQLAHEIKNPLGGLRGAAQLLEKQLLDHEQREYTRVIINEADRLTVLVDSMLGPHRPPAKQLINVHEMLERVYQLLRSEADPGVLMERDYDPSLPLIMVDPDHIIQAMLNLGRNALQAMHGAQLESPRLVLRTRVAHNTSLGENRHRLVASIQFEDNGPGVPADIRDTIFYPLVSGRAQGTGLGLGIAQDLVSRHGGLIEFDSVPGRTVFTILLPMETA
ncbi:MAG: nitrogen regulation protein NR(II) [Steroidobacterales bacterium]